MTAGARKDDAGKPPVYNGFIAYFPRAIKEVAKVSAYGLSKYEAEWTDKGWQKVDRGQERYADALGRHMCDMAIEGVVNHEDGGVAHDAQQAWDALAKLELRLIAEEQAQDEDMCYDTLNQRWHPCHETSPGLERPEDYGPKWVHGLPDGS